MVWEILGLIPNYIKPEYEQQLKRRKELLRSANRQTDRQLTAGQTENEKMDANEQTNRWRCKQTNRQMRNVQIARKIDGQIGKRTDKLKIKHRRFDKHTDQQINVKW